MTKTKLVLKTDPSTILARLAVKKKEILPAQKSPTPKPGQKKKKGVKQSTAHPLKKADKKPEKKKVHQPKKVVLKVKSLYQTLHEKFPEIINIEKPVILAIGIHKDIARELGLSIRLTRRFVCWYMNRAKYKEILKEGETRYNLLGEECGMVTEANLKENAEQEE